MAQAAPWPGASLYCKPGANRWATPTQKLVCPTLMRNICADAKRFREGDPFEPPRLDRGETRPPLRTDPPRGETPVDRRLEMKGVPTISGADADFRGKAA